MTVCDRRSMVQQKLQSKQLDLEVRDLLVKHNGDSSASVVNFFSALGLKLPLNPKKVKSGPRGEVIV